MLTLLKARKIVNQALLRARELNVSVSVAVCDTRGRFIALPRREIRIEYPKNQKVYSQGDPTDAVF
jgi:hypothetical protein